MNDDDEFGFDDDDDDYVNSAAIAALDEAESKYYAAQGSHKRLRLDIQPHTPLVLVSAPITVQTTSIQSAGSLKLPTPVKRTAVTSSNVANAGTHGSDLPDFRMDAEPSSVPIEAEGSSDMQYQMSLLQVMLEQVKAENEKLQHDLRQAVGSRSYPSGSADDLSTRNAKLQEDLRAATQARLEKEGQVTILQQNMNRTAKQHNMEIEKLKAARAEAEARQARAMKEMKDEMERMKTEFIFKHQELESAVRKSPLLARTRRSSLDSPSTPSPAARTWNASQAGPSLSTIPNGTLGVRRSPSKLTRVFPSPEKKRKSAMLPGFQNAFDDSAPVQPRTKERQQAPSPSPKEEQTTWPDIPSTNPFQDDTYMGPAPTFPPPAPSLGDVIMSDGSPPEADIGEDALIEDLPDDIKEFQWGEELCRLLMTHSFKESCEPSLQALIALSSIAGPSAQAYSKEISHVLEAMAHASRLDFATTARTITSSLIAMTDFLRNSTDQSRSLALLLDVITTLSFFLPGFGRILLSTSHDMSGNHTYLLELLCDIIEQRLAPGKVDLSLKTVANEVITTLESLCWHATEDDTDQLLKVIKHERILSNLIHESQPSWFLMRSTKVLALMCRNNHICSAIVSSFPEGSDSRDPSSSSLPRHIEQLCALLRDENLSDEFLLVKVNILIIFVRVLVGHEEAYLPFLKANFVIPSIIFFLHQLCCALWEDDDSLLASSERTSSFVRACNQTLFLLYHIVVRPNTINLRQKLNHAPARIFNGVFHMFVVSIGRLSYADAPEWVSEPDRQELELLSDMAQDLIEMTLDPSENDRVWAAYQGDSAEELDEADMEERMLGSPEL